MRNHTCWLHIGTLLKRFKRKLNDENLKENKLIYDKNMWAHELNTCWCFYNCMKTHFHWNDVAQLDPLIKIQNKIKKDNTFLWNQISDIGFLLIYIWISIKILLAWKENL